MPDPDLGPKPDAEIEPGEPNPGGVDAIEQADGVDGEIADAEPLTRDLHPDDNPVTGEVPLAVKQTEDTSTESTKGDGAEGDSYQEETSDSSAEQSTSEEPPA